MLEQLKLTNLALSDHTELELTPGMICITGETGAGKSLVINAITVISGGRADSSLVRQGCSSMEVSALFSLREDDPVLPLLESFGFADPDSPYEVLLRRVIFAEGKSRSYINGKAATLSQLRDLSSRLITVHGQHAGVRLTDERYQLELVDGYGRLKDKVKELNAVYDEYADLRHRLTALSEMQKSRAANFRQDRYELEELKKLNLQEGDYEQLESIFDRAVHREQFTAALAGLHNLIEGGEANMVSLLRASLSSLHKVSMYDQDLPAFIEDLESTVQHLSDCASRAALMAAESSDFNREEAEQKMSRIHELSRRFACAPKDLYLMTGCLEHKVEEFLSLKDSIHDLTEKVREVRGRYEELSTELTRLRQEAASRLATGVTDRIKSLSLPDASFDILMSRDNEGKPKRGGRDSLCFMFSANKGQDRRPLSAAASGGELSRLSLIIEVLTASVNSTPTLIFDEVDTGISGRTAAAVGALLKELGRFVQVISVTHLPQVAARADTQFSVSKITEKGSVNSRVSLLDTAGRIEEISRMIGGEIITDITRSSARELLQCG